MWWPALVAPIVVGRPGSAAAHESAPGRYQAVRLSTRAGGGMSDRLTLIRALEASGMPI
jgi:hypothetical protein